MKPEDLSPRDKLAAGRLKAAESMPYFGTGLAMLVPYFVTEGFLGTFGVTEDGILMIDEGPLREWPVEGIAFVLVHELQHVLRAHGRRCRAMDANPVLWNLAVDCETNDDLIATDLNPPTPDVCLPKNFGFEDGLTGEEYYRKMREKAEQCPRCGSLRIRMRGGPPSRDGHGEGGEGGQHGQSGAADRAERRGEGGEGGQHGKSGAADREERRGEGDEGCPCCDGSDKPRAAGGWCGSGAGRPVPGEPKGGHSRSELELDALRRQTAEDVRRYSEKNRGSVPAGLLRWAEDMASPPEIDWRTKLARVTRSSIAYRPGAVDFLYNRPSRRQTAIGLGIGHPVLPALRRPVPQVAIAIDTSGSMSRKELGKAVSEADGVLKGIGAEAQLIACDARVGAIKRVRTAQEVANNLVGGGGTDFAPIFDAVNELRPRPEVVIVATDGCGPAPATPPPRTKVIWLLIGAQSQLPWFPNEPWGETIEVGKES